jgi:sigma-B regulation protein RsbU (phosphoserine phosphatase)
MMVDEALAGQVVQFTPEETDWLKTHRVALILPLITHGNLIGFVGLGTKIQKEDYVAEELRILNTLAPQVAVASENIRLLEENVDKRRLEEQLQMARRIQNGFLPHELPPTPGLAVAARNRFCLEVAGDYYDVIPLENGETVLAVADVSGKGAGAALLMANLQASLRTAVGVGTQLAGIVARINDLIHRNTPTEEYITFFAGAFNPKTREFTYVNAGHNPPFLLRRDGSIKYLDKGGLILGTIPGVPYQQETIKLESGELLLMYTDGVSEAMNSAEEEFGDERVARLLQEHASLAPEALLVKLEADVIAFSGSNEFEDDFTLLAARIE